MKRTADEAALSVVQQRFRVNVIVPPEPLTNNQEMHFQLHCDSTSTVDSVKRTLVHQMLYNPWSMSAHFIISDPAGWMSRGLLLSRLQP